MIQLPSHVDAHALAVAIVNDSLLTVEQLNALTTELKKPKYSGKTASECFMILHDPTADYVEKKRLATWSETVAWMQAIHGRLAAGLIDVSPEVALDWGNRIPGLQYYPGADGKPFPPSYAFDPETSLIFQGLALQAKTAGVISDGDVVSFISGLMDTYPISPVEKMFGEGAFLSVSEVEGCMNG